MERRIIIDPFEAACSNDAMPLPKLTDDALVKRLRWVMLGIILFSILNTLAGQPASFWANPQTAIRGDGLSIDNATNHTFDFFLGFGRQPYLMSSLAYASVALLVVSYLPRFAAYRGGNKRRQVRVQKETSSLAVELSCGRGVEEA